MLHLLFAFLLGCLLTLVLVALGFLRRIYSQSGVKDDSTEEKPYIRPQLPQALLCFLGLTEDDGNLEETCHWFNLIVSFIFNELRDSEEAKRFMMKKINKEFEELMFTKTEGRMIEQLTVRDYSLGTSMPIIEKASISRVEGCTPEHPAIEELDIILNVKYDGNWQVEIDANLLFDKAAYVSVEMPWLKGRGRLRFSRKGETNWSFAFIEDPMFELEVKSNFEGRRYPQLSSIIESQLRKWLKKRHTLPAYKIRYKPFFKKFKLQNQLLDVYVHDKKLTTGKLAVSVLECSRLQAADGAYSVYCTLSVGSLPWQPMVHLWRNQWPVYEFLVKKRAAEEIIGIKYKMVERGEEERDKRELIIVSNVVDPSAANRAGVKEGDVLTRINNVKVSSIRQARKLMKIFKDEKSVLINIQRPPAHFISYLLGGTVPPSHGQRGTNTTDSAVSTHPVLASISESPTFTSSMCMDVPAPSDGAYLSVPRGRSHTTTSPDLFSRSVSSPMGTTTSSTSTITSRTPLSGEDERDNATHRRDGRRGQEDDTLSLFGVGGEREEGAGIRRRQDGRIPQGDTSESSTRNSRLSQSVSLASPLLPLHATVLAPPPPVSDDAVDMGGMSSFVEGIEGEGGGGGGDGGGMESGRSEQSSRDEQQKETEEETKEVRACKNPRWNQKVIFNIEDDHHYLNICIHEKFNDDRGDHLIGHVTIPLVDVAMECFHTTSGTHRQRYVIMAAHPARASTSRVVVQANAAASNVSMKKKVSSSDVNTKIYAGDIFLKFKHSPSLAGKDRVVQPETQDVHNESASDHQASGPSSGEAPYHGQHVFRIVNVGKQKCEICSGIKLSQVEVCRNCGIKCHKKCQEYCIKAIPCRKRGSGGPAPADQPATVVDEQHSTEEEDEGEEPNTHQILKQRRRIDSFEMVEAPREEEEGEGDGGGGVSGYDTADDDDAAVVLGLEDIVLVPENTQEEKLEGVRIEQVEPRTGMTMVVEMEEDHVQSCDHEEEYDGDSYREEELYTPFPDSDGELTSSYDRSPKLLWSGHYPPCDRERMLNKKLSSNQVEINRIQEIMNDLYDSMKKPDISNSEKKRLRSEIVHYEEKMVPLKFLMNETMTELARVTQRNQL